MTITGGTEPDLSKLSDENIKNFKDKDKSEKNKWGYELYPERRGDKLERNWAKLLVGMEGKENITKLKCERNVYNCVKNSPLIKLMMGALKSSGCEIDIRRHISCEVCDTSVSGGYDPLMNQVVVCQNIAQNEGMVQGVLAHEMIHMFDYCRNELDFKNIDHLACTEIRAANLTHCSFMSSWSQGDSSPFNIKETHQNCVKTKALASVLAVRKVSTEEAIQAVERVFPKCYNDLEPIGRRLRRNSTDMHRAYREVRL
jgi:inner membrane protease ATP23